MNMLFTSTAIACALALGPITNQRAEAASVLSAAMVDTASTSLASTAESGVVARTGTFGHSGSTATATAKTTLIAGMTDI